MALSNIGEHGPSYLKHTKINYNNNHVSLKLIHVQWILYYVDVYIYIYRYINIF